MRIITNLNPITILDGAPLVLTRVKSLAIHEFSGLDKSKEAAALRLSVSLRVIIAHLGTWLEVFDAASPELLALINLKEM